MDSGRSGRSSSGTDPVLRIFLRRPHTTTTTAAATSSSRFTSASGTLCEEKMSEKPAAAPD
ncbi:hypothetical protein WMY93_014050 [Mugilogobius chulae]|uniref:Uncharacterized protein n=1 Tax=Mugilogobius chulae TaxID=88201 RepID=A0AAW0NXY9_9GOBI